MDSISQITTYKFTVLTMSFPPQFAKMSEVVKRGAKRIPRAESSPATNIVVVLFQRRGFPALKPGQALVLMCLPPNLMSTFRRCDRDDFLCSVRSVLDSFNYTMLLSHVDKKQIVLGYHHVPHRIGDSEGHFFLGPKSFDIHSAFVELMKVNEMKVADGEIVPMESSNITPSSSAGDLAQLAETDYKSPPRPSYGEMMFTWPKEDPTFNRNHFKSFNGKAWSALPSDLRRSQVDVKGARLVGGRFNDWVHFLVHLRSTDIMVLDCLLTYMENNELLNALGLTSEDVFYHYLTQTIFGKDKYLPVSFVYTAVLRLYQLGFQVPVYVEDLRAYARTPLSVMRRMYAKTLFTAAYTSLLAKLMSQRTQSFVFDLFAYDVAGGPVPIPGVHADNEIVVGMLQATHAFNMSMVCNGLPHLVGLQRVFLEKYHSLPYRLFADIPCPDGEVMFMPRKPEPQFDDPEVSIYPETFGDSDCEVGQGPFGWVQEPTFDVTSQAGEEAVEPNQAQLSFLLRWLLGDRVSQHVADTVENAAEVTKNLAEGASKSTPESVVRQVFASATDSFSGIWASMSNLFSELKDLFSQIASLIKPFIPVIVMSLVMFFVQKYQLFGEKWVKYLFKPILLFLQATATYKVQIEFMAYAKKMFDDKEEEVTSQGMDEVLSKGTVLISSLFMTYGFDLSTAGFTKMLKEYTMVSRGVETLGKNLFEFVVALFGTAGEWIGFNPLGFGRNTPAWEWVEKARKLVETHKQNMLPMTPMTLSTIETLYLEGVSLYSRVQKTNEAHAIMLKGFIDKLFNVKTDLAPKIRTGQIRARPVIIFSFGDSGSGKTVSANALADTLCRYELRNNPRAMEVFEANSSEFIYTRSGEKYFDGISPLCTVIKYDDFGQGLEVRGQDTNEWLELIKIANEETFQPTMAKAELKGNISVRCPYVIVTTNMRSLNNEAIREIQAVARRLDAIVKVVKVAETPIEKGYDPSAQEFYLNHVNDSNAFVDSCCPVSFKDLVTFCVTRRAEYVKFAESMKGMLEGVYDSSMAHVEKLSKSELRGVLFKFKNAKEMDDSPKKPDLVDRVRLELAEKHEMAMRPEGSRKLIEELPGTYSQAGDEVTLFTDTTDPIEVVRSAPSSTVNEVARLFTYLRNRPAELTDRAMAWQFVYKSANSTKEFDPYVDCFIRHTGIISNAHGMVDQIFDQLGETKATVTVNNFETFLKEVDLSNLDATVYINRDLIQLDTTDWNSLKESLKSSGWRIYQKLKEFINAHPLAVFTVAAITAELLVSYFDVPKTESQSVGAHKQQSRLMQRGLKDKQVSLLAMVNRNGKGADLAKHTNLVHSQGAQEILERVAFVRKNMRKYYHKNLKRDGWVMAGTAIGIYDDVIMIPRHFALATMNPAINGEVSEDSIIFRLGDDSSQIEVKMMDCTYLAESVQKDMCIIRLNDRNKWSFKDIRKHFMDKNVSDTLYLNAQHEFGGMIVTPDMGMSFECGVSTHSQVINPGLENEYTVTQVLSYPVATAKGHCGSPVVLTKGRFAGFIAGFHIAGDGKTHGYCNRITREQLGYVVPNEPSNVELVQEEEKLLDIDSGAIEIRDGIVVEESCLEGESSIVLTDNAAISQGGLLSKIGLQPGEHPGDIFQEDVVIPSNIFVSNKIVPYVGEGVPPMVAKTAPSMVDPKFYPKARSAYTFVEHDWEASTMEVIRNAITERIRRCSPHTEFRTFNLVEAICGIEGTAFHPLDPSTSNGYPDTAHGVKRRDYWFFNDGKPQLGPKYTELVRRIQHLVDVMTSGGVPQFTFMSVLKSERRSHKKIAAGETRAVFAGPIDLLLLCRMFFGAAILACRNGSVQNGMLLGVNYASESWDALAQYLTRVGGGQHCGSGDYKGFDGHTSKLFNVHSMTALADLYPKTDTLGRRVRMALITAVADSYHIFGPVAEIWHGCLSSGFPLTTECNCITNISMFMYHYLSLYNFDFSMTHNFWTEIALVVLGDDNLFSVCPKLKTHFTEATFAVTAAKFGHVYTSADKTEPHTVNTPLFYKSEDEPGHSILKCRFRPEPALGGRVVGPLDLNVVMERVMWTKDGNQYDAIAASNLDASVLDLSLHGREVFEECYEKLRTFYGTKFHPRATSFETALALRTSEAPEGIF